MAKTPIFQVEYCIRNAKTGSFRGQADNYRKDLHKAYVAASSSHPKDILAVLTSNVTLATGESIDVLSVANAQAGTEGQNILS
jgi:hypothetical protein